MKIIFTTLAVGLLLNQLNAQQPVSFLLDSSGGSQTTFSNDCIYFTFNNKVIKTDYYGNIIWSKENVQPPDVLADGYYYSVVGYNPIKISKSDTSGDLIWRKDIS